MSIIKYAIITSDNLTVGVVGFFDTASGSFASFQSAYTAENPTKQVIDITGSQFPSGQGWQLNNDVYTPLDGAYHGVAEVKEKICNYIFARTDQIQYDGFVTFRGKQFPRDHDTRDNVVMLANSVIGSSTLAAEILPLRVNAIDFSELTLTTVTDAQDFALAMLSPRKGLYADQADQIAAVQAMTTVSQLVQYIDPR